MSHLDELENEAIHVLREAWAQFDKPVILFSGGKDSIVVTHLAQKAFFPGKIPFALLHIDTGHNFPETIKFRDALVERLSLELIVGSVQESIDKARVVDEIGRFANRNALQTTTLLDTIAEQKIDCAIGGGRRDEEKARAKERFFSHRDSFGQWRPKEQRPELWNIFNGRHNEGEHFRVFPISNFTEADIWQYIVRESIAIPSLYFAHSRKVIWRNNSWLPYSEYTTPESEEEIVTRQVRFRTLGDITITGAIESEADTLEKIAIEVMTMRMAERSNRSDDKRSETSMEDRKREGYF